MPVQKDHTGEKFNMLTVIERLPNYKNNKTYYDCLCECGKHKIIPNDRVGKTYSCGCSLPPSKRIIDLTGEQYGLLTVTKMLPHGKCECLCKCGNTTIVKRSNIRNGHTKSCGCFEISSRFGRENHWIDLSGQRFGHLTVVRKTDERSSNSSVIWECFCDCGNIVYVSSPSLITGHTRSCGCNKRSKYEEWVVDILEEANIQYLSEHRFKDCKNQFQLPFDFYLPKYNICIECQGSQHYEPVEHWGGENKLKTVQLNDKIKRKYCIDNDIYLLILPYTLSYNEFKNKILGIIKPVTITA